MERCVHKHLNEYLMINSIITPNQSGFQSGDSTVNQLLYLNNTFHKALDDGKEVRVLFCDISKAFDRVWHKGLLFKLKSIGISNELLKWFSDYLSNRRQRVCLKGQFSSWRQDTAGVPQGSILGPTLFLIYINDIVKEINANIRLFAADTSLFVIVEDPITAANLLNNELTKISSSAGKWLVKFNPNKTISFIITRRKNKQRHPSLFMNNIEIKEVPSHKHLELTFSDDGTWHQHIAAITSAAWKRIGTLWRNKFALDKLSLSKIYLTHIRPLLEYANIIWDNCSVEKKTKKKTLPW